MNSNHHYTPHTDDLELLMVGTPHLDFKELENTTTYLGDENVVNSFFQFLLHYEKNL